MKIISRFLGLLSLVYVFGVIPTFAQEDESKFKNDSLLESFNFKDSIVYKTVNGQALEMLMFFPKNKSKSKLPVMMFTHGGGWTGGDRYVVLKKQFVGTMQRFLDQGIACVSIEYRLNKGNVTIRDQVIDCKDAGRFIHKNADKFGFNPDKIGVWGGSAGGHLSLMTGLADNKLFPGDKNLIASNPVYNCIVSFYPATSFTNLEILNATPYLNQSKLTKMFGEDISKNPSLARLVSPVEYLNKITPPVMVLHGTADVILSYKNATYFQERAKATGSNVQLITVKNGGHGFSGKNVSPSLDEVSMIASDFIVKHLAKP